VQVSACLVVEFQGYNCFGEVSFFSSYRSFEMEQRALFFCVELKKASTETFQVLKSSCCEDCLSRASVFE
jgi:hypothetical protein